MGTLFEKFTNSLSDGVYKKKISDLLFKIRRKITNFLVLHFSLLLITYYLFEYNLFKYWENELIHMNTWILGKNAANFVC